MHGAGGKDAPPTAQADPTGFAWRLAHLSPGAAAQLCASHLRLKGAQQRAGRCGKGQARNAHAHPPQPPPPPPPTHLPPTPSPARLLINARRLLGAPPERHWLGMWFEGVGGWRCCKGADAGGGDKEAAAAWMECYDANVQAAAERWAPELCPAAAEDKAQGDRRWLVQYELLRAARRMQHAACCTADAQSAANACSSGWAAQQ